MLRSAPVKPRTAQRVRGDDPLSKALVMLFTCDEGGGVPRARFGERHEFSTSFAGTGTPTWRDGRWGKEVDFAGSTDRRIELEAGPPALGDHWTFACAIYFDDNATDQFLLAKSDGDTANSFRFRPDGGNSIGFISDGYAGVNISVDAAHLADGYGVWVVTRAGTAFAAYKDGAPIGTTTSSEVYDWTLFTRIGCRGNATAPFIGALSMFGLWRWPFTHSDAVRIARDPFVFVREQQRFVGKAAAVVASTKIGARHARLPVLGRR